MTKTATPVIPSLVELMEAGAHFGHKKHRSHPMARKYVFTIRDRVLVINLESTRQQLTDASEYLAERARSGAMILLVGTKRQASERIKELGEAVEQPYVHQRWLGGTLTNFETIQKRLKRLRELEGLVVSEGFVAEHTKKQRVTLERELARLERTLGGLKPMTRLPDVVLIVDTDEESNTLAEAKRLKIPVVAIVDTNADPDAVTKPIVANDDSARSVALILATLRSAIERGKTTPAITPVASLEAADTKEAPPADATPAPKPVVKKTATTKSAVKPSTVKKPATAKQKTVGKKPATKKPAAKTKKATK